MYRFGKSAPQTEKIIGQVQAIDTMIDEDIPYEDILLQSMRQNRRFTNAVRLFLKGI